MERRDNPKHFLTSNRTLDSHVDHTFRSQEARTLARRNLRARIQQVIVPPGVHLHLLRKLFVPRDCD